VEEFIDFLMQLLKTRPQWGLIPLRVVFGIVLVMQSRDILIQKRREARIFFHSVQWIPLKIVTVVAKITQVLGFLMIFGFLGRLTGIAVLFLGITAIILEIYKKMSHLRDNFEIRMRMMLMAVACVFVFSGSGRYSADWYITAGLEHFQPNPVVHAYIHSEMEIEGVKWWW